MLAVDCCDGFLEYGRRDARAARLSNVTFLEADVQLYIHSQPVHDFCFSRLAPSFSKNPVAGLRNMRTSLKAGGIMTMVVWRGIKDNPWLGHAKDIVLKFLPPPGENAQTCGPGPFSMADTDVVTKQLEIAGYKDIEFEQIDAQVFVGNDLDDAVAFQLAIGPAGEVYREAGKLAEERHEGIANVLSRLRKVSAAATASSWIPVLEGDRQKPGIASFFSTAQRSWALIAPNWQSNFRLYAAQAFQPALTPSESAYLCLRSLEGSLMERYLRRLYRHPNLRLSHLWNGAYRF